MVNNTDSIVHLQDRLSLLTDEMMRTLIILRGIIYTLENESDIVHTLRKVRDTESINIYESVTSMLYLLLEQYENLSLTYSTGSSTPE